MNINWAHVHLMINHIPVIGMIGIMLLLAYALIRKSEEVKIVSFGLLVLVALATIPVFLTGERAEDAVKQLPGVTEAFIGRHEEAAEYTLILMLLVGAAALAGLILLRIKGSVPKTIVILVLVLSLLATAAVGFTANLGGEIRHTEIRAGALGKEIHR
ncbi:MAG TPA: hypothetical protein VK654_08255 [Nitrospirota bacterium]|nr:hypothetical protein [Nitrospirota bacterium]